MPTPPTRPPPVPAPFGCLFLLVGRVAVFAQDAPDQDPELGADIFPQRPVYGYVASDGFDQFLCNGTERLVSQHLHGTVVGFQGIVEGQLILGQAKPFASVFGFPHVPGQLDQFLNHL